VNTAIIVAAGSGTRFNSEIPKQFVELAGKPLIVHTIERFEAAETIDSIVLVLAPERLHEFGSISDNFGFRKLTSVVAGGETRAESARNGLIAVPDATEIVAVHDGARPLVSPDEIDATVQKASETGAACLVAPVTDTIKEIRGGEIAATLDRTQLRHALTPQAFRLEVLRAAFENTALDDSITDECFLVETLGHPIAVVEGSPRNIKITQPDDLKIAQRFLEDLESRGMPPLVTKKE
jgi:2-C-methyl-D-erythritol 4-phosphate cytidylyltransferase